MSAACSTAPTFEYRGDSHAASRGVRDDRVDRPHRVGDRDDGVGTFEAHAPVPAGRAVTRKVEGDQRTAPSFELVDER